MNLEYFIKKEANYNLWANKRMAEWLLQKPSKLMKKEVPSSYSSLFTTVLHILDTQRFWLSLITQSELLYFRNAYESSSEELLNEWIEQSGSFANHIKSLSNDNLLKECEINTEWTRGVKPVFEFVHHCLNHSSYHRGQLVTIARNAGILDPPNTDYNFFDPLQD